MACVVIYLNQKDTEGREWLAGVAFEDKGRGSDFSETFLADGMIYSKNKGYLRQPIQEVKAQNIIGKSKDSPLQGEIIKQIKGKFKSQVLKADSFKPVLVISAYGRGGQRDNLDLAKIYEEILNEYDFDYYGGCILLIAYEDFKRVELFRLDLAHLEIKTFAEYGLRINIKNTK